MPIPIEVLAKLGEIQTHIKEGRLIEAQTLITQVDVQLQSIKPAMNPTEILMLTAAIGNFLKSCGSYEAAARRLERACELALKLDPYSSKTVGDLTDLAECYQMMGRLPDAIAVFQRARPICIRVLPNLVPRLDMKIQELHKQLAGKEQTSLTNSLQVSLHCPSINYSIEHSGISSIRSLKVLYDGSTPLYQIPIKVTIPSYTIPSEITIPILEPKKEQEIVDLVHLRLVPERLATQTERARAQIEVWIGGQLVFRGETWVLTYNECSWYPGHEKALAAFIHPNNAAVKVIARQAQESVQQIGRQGSFRLMRESGVPGYVETIAQAIYSCLHDQYDLIYDYEPPSWESYSQRVRFPDEVVVSGTGTCIDLALLFTSVLESTLYSSTTQPVLIITSGISQHALIGCWNEQPYSNEILLTNKTEIQDWARSGKLFIMDSTGFARENPFWGNKVAFEVCVHKGTELLEKSSRAYAINLTAVRPNYQLDLPGITPLPFRGDPPYGENALKALWLARQEQDGAPLGKIQSTHLLLGLLRLSDGRVRSFFETLAIETANPLLEPIAMAEFLNKGLSKIAQQGRQAPIETESFVYIKEASRQEAKRSGALMVDDIHLLFALLRQPGESVTKVLRLLNSSPQECLAYLEKMYPAPATAMRSEFPSEVID